MESQALPKARKARASWERALARNLRTAADLRREGLIDETEEARLAPLLGKYKLSLPRYYAALIDRADPNCPIRRQAIPHPDELVAHADFLSDPLSDRDHQPARRITHRYPGRALLHLTSSCSMYCRFCFRKSLLNELQADLFGGALDEAFAYLKAHAEIEEVIFSGGDPLMTSDLALRSVIRRLAELPHLRRLRLHTRVPVTFPERVTETLATVLSEHRLPTVLVTHFNHPRELTAESTTAAARLKRAGLTLLNQSVLLRGVNDDAHVLTTLNEGLFAAGILPYYLHHPDRAQGTAHFDLGYEEGLRLYETLRATLPGYLVPRYVVDIVGHPYKRPVAEVVASQKSPHLF